MFCLLVQAHIGIMVKMGQKLRRIGKETGQNERDNRSREREKGRVRKGRK